jgi:threonine dehydrogenase-like Zn-dependent dehydrogenase
MKAITFENQQVQLKPQEAVPTCGEGEALIRVLVAGVCNTDLELIKGYMGFEGILGHEFVGVVEACSDTTWLGKRVCADINAACGVCPVCVDEKNPHHCPNRTVIGILNHGGAFAQYVKAPIVNLVAVPESVSNDRAVFTEPLAAAFEIVEQRPIHPHERVIVLGDGKLGLLIAQVLSLSTPNVTLVGRHHDKLALLRPMGVATRNSREESLDDLQKSAHVVVEVTGTAEGLDLALNLCRPRGTVVLKSTVAEGKPLNLAPLVIDEITLLGSRCGPFERTMQALEAGKLQPEVLIQHRFPLEKGVEAIEQAAQKGTLKVLIECG